MIYRAGSICPSIHLPMEKYLMGHAIHPSCFIRTNPKSVVIGSNQLAQAECNLAALKRDNIKLIRRQSGGGAVFLDEGNCMFGLFGDAEKVTINDFNNILTSAINKTFGVDSYPTGKNDISVDGHKVAGLAYHKNKNKFLCHACILVNANTSLLPLYLTPNQKKIESKCVKSIDKRVINLCEFDKSKTRVNLEDAISEEYFEKFLREFSNNIDYNAVVIKLSSNDMMDIEEVKKMNLEMNNDEYLFGNKFEYNMKISRKFSWGFIELYLKLNTDIIVDVVVNTDCLDVTIPKELKELIINKNIKNLHLEQHQNIKQEIKEIIQMICQ
jgi:lipoate-protein ligase A